MKRIFTILAIAIVAVTSNTYAQYSGDALRFSQKNYGTTARFKGMGGAALGVGGDLSSLGGNPAGLGLLTKSEFNFTPDISAISTDTRYLGQGTNTTKTTPNINQAGVAFYVPSYKTKGSDATKGIISFVAGIGYNRTADYNNDINFSGLNPQNSIADYFAELAGSGAPATLAVNSLENWAYQNYLISYDSPAASYFPETFVNNTQSSNDVRKGGISELSFSGAVNISNQFYIGIDVGLLSLRYIRDARYTESGVARAYTSAGVLTGGNANYRLLFSQSQTTTGEGLNGRIGVIFRPVSEFRIGASIETPTFFDIEDSYMETLDNTGSTNGKINSNTYDYAYKLRTPLKASLGASYIIGGTALLTADVDYIDYSSTRLSENGSFQSALTTQNNAEIRQNYSEAVNFRIGGEYKISSLSLRAGYGYNGSPYTASDFKTQVYSGGLGYRYNNYYFDLAYQRVDAESTISPYTLNDFSEPTAALSTSKNNVFFTLGVRF